MSNSDNNIQERLELETTDIQQDKVPQMQMSDSGVDTANDQYRGSSDEHAYGVEKLS